MNRGERVIYEEMPTLRFRDEGLGGVWYALGDVPVDPETEKIEDAFMWWPAGTDREDIWRWFDERHSKGVAYLLYGGAENYVQETKRLYELKKTCFECESSSCQYNHQGECRFALVHERKPRITDEDGCIDYDFNEGEH